MATNNYEKNAVQGHAVWGNMPLLTEVMLFNYYSMKLSAAKQFPTEYEKEFY